MKGILEDVLLRRIIADLAKISSPCMTRQLRGSRAKVMPCDDDDDDGDDDDVRIGRLERQELSLISRRVGFRRKSPQPS